VYAEAFGEGVAKVIRAMLNIHINRVSKPGQKSPKGRNALAQGETLGKHGKPPRPANQRAHKNHPETMAGTFG